MVFSVAAFPTGTRPRTCSRNCWVVKSIGRYDHRDTFDAWIYRIALNLVRDRVRKSARLSGKFRLVEGQGAGGDEIIGTIAEKYASPEEQLADGEQFDQLQQALQKLPDEQREVLLLRHFSGLSFSQIAETLGRPIGTVLARAHRGVEKLRKLLNVESA